MRIRHRAVIVTGASSGIGLETARLLARKGARVWAVARSKGRLDELAEATPGITPFPCDVAVEADRAALVEATGPVDVLVNNAGIGWSGRFEEMTPEEIRRLYEVNVLGLIDLTHRVLPGMVERRRGHVCNVGSIAGFVSTPPFSVYASTKFAVQGFTDGLRREMLGRRVSISLVTPGPFATRFFSRSRVGDVEEPGHDRLGLPPVLVARAIVRGVRMGGTPGWRTISVPRVAGLSRLGAVPGLALLVDGASLVSRPLDLWSRSWLTREATEQEGGSPPHT